MLATAIRRAGLADAEAIAAVHVATWHETYTGLMPQAVIDARTVPARIERWRRILGAAPPLGDTIHVAEIDGRIVGFSGAGAPRSVAAFAEAELSGLYLLAAHYGRGVGRALIEAAAMAARERGAATLGLWVLTANARARRFYEKVGAVAVTAREEVLDGEAIAEIGYRLDL